MKKRILIIIQVLLFVFLFSGCNNNNVDFKYSDVRVYDTKELIEPKLILIKTFMQKYEYINQDILQSEDYIYFKLQASKYDDKYFNDKDLIIMSYISNGLDIKKIYLDENTLIIKLKKSKGVSNCEYAPVACFIEISKVSDSINFVEWRLPT